MTRLDRPDLYVVSRFLEHLWRDGKRHRKPELQMAVRLNYDVYRKYLDWLVEKEMVAISLDDEGRECVAITPRGLDTYRRLVEWIKETVGDEYL